MPTNTPVAVNAVAVSGLGVMRAPNGALVIYWTTLSEHDALGFYVYRAEGHRQETTLPVDAQSVSGALISATGGSSGANYQVLDQATRIGAIYSYWLVEVGVDGTQTVYGPTRAQSGFTISLPIVVMRK